MASEGCHSLSWTGCVQQEGPITGVAEGLRADWCVGVPGSGQGGPEDEGGHDAEARPSGAPGDDVPAARAGQDPPQCLR